MKHLRPKPAEWNRPFRIIDRKDDFNRSEGLDIDSVASKNSEKKGPIKKEEIVVPRIDIIALTHKSANDAGIPLNFIRIPIALNLPKMDKYELSEVDYTFVMANQNKYIYNNKKALSTEFLERAIVELELIAGKDCNVIPKNIEARLRAMIEKEFDYVLKMENSDEFIKAIYNHWRSRREELKQPLLRMLWKPNPEDQSHYLAFRPREKEEKDKKKQLRRANKPTEDEIIGFMEGLQREFQQSRGIAERIKLRERVKLMSLTADFQKFNQEVKAFHDEPFFGIEINKKDIAKNKENMSRLKKMFENQKNNEQIIQKQVLPELVEDTKSSVINFLATLIQKAASQGVVWDSFNPNKIYAKVEPPQTDISVAGETPSAPVPVPVVVRPEPAAVVEPKPSAPVKPPAPKPPVIDTTFICKFNVTPFKSVNEYFIQRNFNKQEKNIVSDPSMSKFGIKSSSPPINSNIVSEVQPLNPWNVNLSVGGAVDQRVKGPWEMRHQQIVSHYFFEDDEEDVRDTKKTTSNNFKKFLSQKIAS